MTYELTPEERNDFGITEVTAVFDENLNGIVINHPDNGLLAGDRLRSRKNPYFDQEQLVSSANRPYTFMLTDDYNAEQSVRLAEVRRSGEEYRLQRLLGELSVIGANLPRLTGADEAAVARYAHAFSRIIGEEQSSLNPDKRGAAAALAEGLEMMRDRGQEIPEAVQHKAVEAAEKYAARRVELLRQERANQQRRRNLRYEFHEDLGVRNSLKNLAAEHGAIAENAREFLHQAAKRRTKPGVLSVNNAWFRRAEADSWRQYVLAQEGWEPLYGALMKPMSMLANETVKASRGKPEHLLGKYALELLALEDMLDLSMIGGDYDDLAVRLRDMLFEAEEFVIRGNAAKATAAAQKYRFMLRYRALPGQDPPKQWYGGLPNVSSGWTPVELPEEVIEDPFQGLDG